MTETGQLITHIPLPKELKLPNRFLALNDGRAIILTRNEEFDVVLCVGTTGKVDWQIRPLLDRDKTRTWSVLSVDSDGTNLAIVYREMAKTETDQSDLVVQQYDKDGKFLAETSLQLPSFVVGHSHATPAGQRYIVGYSAHDDSHGSVYVAHVTAKGELRPGLSRIDKFSLKMAVTDTACWLLDTRYKTPRNRRIDSDMIHENSQEYDVQRTVHDGGFNLDAAGPDDSFYFIADDTNGHCLYRAQFIKQPQIK